METSTENWFFSVYCNDSRRFPINGNYCRRDGYPKLTRKNAAEFSFFLAVPTMAAATGYTLYKMMKDPMRAILIGDNLTMLIVGNVVAFIVALVAIKFFIDFLTKHGFKAFGYYRIIVGGLLLILLGTGIVQNII